MRLAIVSDFHIGYERFAEDAYTQAKEALGKAAELADAILIPGDVFDKRSPKPEVIAQAINIFRNLKERQWKARVTGFKSEFGNTTYTDVPIIAIPGTHERTAEGKENPLTLLGLAGLLVDASEATATISLDGENVCVYGMGGISEDRVREVLKGLSPKPIENAFNVFMFHQSIYELLPFNESFLHYDELPKGFDLYIDGHIHTKVIGKVHGADFLIPGSTVITQLKDGEQERKGFFIYDTKSKQFTFEEINSRPFYSISIECNGLSPDELVMKIEEEAKRYADENKKPIIKVAIKGSLKEGFKAIDVPLKNVYRDFAGIAIIDIDSSKLVDAGTEKSIEELREGKLNGLPIKEQGISMLLMALKQSNYNGKLDPIELFNILTESENKEAIKKKVAELIDKTLEGS